VKVHCDDMFSAMEKLKNNIEEGALRTCVFRKEAVSIRFVLKGIMGGGPFLSALVTNIAKKANAQGHVHQGVKLGYNLTGATKPAMNFTGTTKQLRECMKSWQNSCISQASIRFTACGKELAAKVFRAASYFTESLKWEKEANAYYFVSQGNTIKKFLEKLEANEPPHEDLKIEVV